MSAVALIVLALLVFALAYRYYGAFIAARILALSDDRQTPAVRFEDGKNYHVTNKWVVFGHHFAAIAGAGPLIGPVLAAQFGYLPGLIWILVGAVLAGAVHDFIILTASLRADGKSIAEIAKDNLSRLSGIITMVAVLFIIITALAGLGMVVVNALAESAWGTSTILLTIPIAMFIGIYMEWIRKGRVGEASAIGIVMVLGAVLVGAVIHTSDSLAPLFTFSLQELSVGLAFYGFLASVLPVWLLLAPRDYLSSYMKIGTVFILAIGIFIVNPKIEMPAFTEYIHGNGPIITGKVWPFVCITIACGAISGFHSLIASGTTPKMLAKESQALMVGYGAMLMEGVVAVLALVSATVLIPGDYFAMNVIPERWAEYGIVPQELFEFGKMVSEDLAGRTAGSVTLAIGMAHIFSSLPGMREFMAYWYHFAIMFEALFILTTIDAGTRVARYLLQEALGRINNRLGDINFLPAVLVSSGIVSMAWGYLLYANDVSTIWPMFGCANQLLATLGLVVATSYVLRHSKRRIYGLITGVPALFMAITTSTAGFQSILNNYLVKARQGDFNGYLNAALTFIMIVCVFIVLTDGVVQILKTKVMGDRKVEGVVK